MLYEHANNRHPHAYLIKCYCHMQWKFLLSSLKPAVLLSVHVSSPFTPSWLQHCAPRTAATCRHRQGDREWSRDIWIRPERAEQSLNHPSTCYAQPVHVLMFVSQNNYYLSCHSHCLSHHKYKQSLVLLVTNGKMGQLMLTKMKWTVIKLSPSHVVEGEQVSGPRMLTLLYINASVWVDSQHHAVYVYINCKTHTSTQHH